MLRIGVSLARILRRKKGLFDKGKSPLQIYNARAPFERLQMDILGPFPSSSSGNKYILVIVDYFTKWVEVFPLKSVRPYYPFSVPVRFLNDIFSRSTTILEEIE